MSDFAAAVDAQFDALGVEATLYVDGEARPVRVLPNRPDTLTDYGDARLIRETAMFDIRAADFEGLADGVILEVDGQVREVRSHWVPDARRLKVRLDTTETSA